MKVSVKLFPFVGEDDNYGGYETIEVYLDGDLYQVETPCKNLTHVEIPKRKGRYQLRFLLRSKAGSENTTKIDQFIEVK